VVQDLLQAHDTGTNEVSGGDEKVALIKWIAIQGKFLSKITIQIGQLANGELGSGLVMFTPCSAGSLMIASNSQGGLLSRLFLPRLTGRSSHIPIDTSYAQGPADTGRPRR